MLGFGMRSDPKKAEEEMRRRIFDGARMLLDGLNDEELAAFEKRLKDRLKLDQNIEFSCEPKLDGLAVSILLLFYVLHEWSFDR